MTTKRKCLPRLRDKLIEYAIGDVRLADLWEAYLANYEQLCKLVGVEPQLPPPPSKGAVHLFERVLNSTITEFSHHFRYRSASAHWE